MRAFASSRSSIPSSSSPSFADHERQRQALADERHEDDRERQEEDEVASGNGAPSSVVSGTASAAASDTAPRIPAHETNTAPSPARYAPGHPLREVEDDEDPGKRAAITVALTSAA